VNNVAAAASASINGRGTYAKTAAVAASASTRGGGVNAKTAVAAAFASTSDGRTGVQTANSERTSEGERGIKHKRTHIRYL